MAHSQVETIDTVIVGNGPSALILSYILHGNIPTYTYLHPDPSLHANLRSNRNLLDCPLSALAAVSGSLKYSTQALPIDTLLDTLLRPDGDTSTSVRSCITWKHDPAAAVPHLVLGDAPKAGGQWASNPVEASWDIGTLSYADQLSLPGYTIADHWQATTGSALADLTRPTRSQVAEYYAAYPEAAGIADSLRYSQHVRSVHRSGTGFVITSQGRHIHCKHLVLASGIYTINNPPPPLLAPLTHLSGVWQGPVLVIGSGFTAADIIMSIPPERKVLHIFNWDPDKNPSPLKACHPTAYPEYAAIYLIMKSAAERLLGIPWRGTRTAAEKLLSSSTATVPANLIKRNWHTMYEGLPNSRIMSTGPEAEPVSGSSYGNPKFTNDESGRRRSLFHSGPRRSSSIDGNTHANRSASVDANAPATAAPAPATAIPPGHPILGNKAATLKIGYSSIGDTVTRTISDFHWVTGRSGSLAYLSSPLLREIMPRAERMSLQVDDFDIEAIRRKSSSGRPSIDSLNGSERRTSDSGIQDFAAESKVKQAQVTGSTLRDKIEDPGATLTDQTRIHGDDEAFGMMEVARNVFAVGSLTGDSLVRFAYGGCCAVAGRLMRANGITLEHGEALPADLAPPVADPQGPPLLHVKTPEEREMELAPAVAMGRSPLNAIQAVAPSGTNSPAPEKSDLNGTPAPSQPDVGVGTTEAVSTATATTAAAGAKAGKAHKSKKDKCVVQ